MTASLLSNTRDIRRFAAWILVALAPATAQQPQVFASRLLNPLKIILGPQGTFLTAEAGRDPNSGRISLITSTGVRRTLIDKLPSGISGPDPDGPTGLVLEENTLFVTIGEGNQYIRGTVPGTTLMSTSGPSSPIFDSILQLDFSQPVDRIQTGFTLDPKDHYTLADGGKVTLNNGLAESVTISLLSAFRFRPDPETIYRNSHPFSLTTLPSRPGSLYLVNAGLNSLVQVNARNGRFRTIVHFDNLQNFAPTGPAVSDAVPTSVRPYGSLLLVTLYSGFPFGPVNSKVVVVDPVTRAISPFLDQLSTAIDIVHQTRPNAGSQFYVLEYSSDRTVTPAAPGMVLMFDGRQKQVLATRLNAPTSMVLDEATGKLYITSFADGTVLELKLNQ